MQTETNKENYNSRNNMITTFNNPIVAITRMEGKLAITLTHNN